MPLNMMGLNRVDLVSETRQLLEVHNNVQVRDNSL